MFTVLCFNLQGVPEKKCTKFNAVSSSVDNIAVPNLERLAAV